MMTQAQIHQAIKDCFHDAVAGQPHCYFGDPVREEDGDRCWTLRFDNDSFTIGGQTIPLHSDVVACPKHHAMLTEFYEGPVEEPEQKQRWVVTGSTVVEAENADEAIRVAFEGSLNGWDWDAKVARDCDVEFGPDHDHDDVECARILNDMSPDIPYDDGLAEALNREAEEDRLGRPLFPKEY